MKPPSAPQVEVLPDAASLAERAAQIFISSMQTALHAGKRFTVALAGGSTPRLLYSRLAASALDWAGVHLFWGDERCVPPADAESNFRMAKETLLDSIAISPANIHRILGELPPGQGARKYEQELRRFFGDEIPRFDLVLLGLGEDGHTASLFPGNPALQERERRVLAVRHRVQPEPLVDRITLTLPVLNAAALVLFLVSGAAKAERVAQVLQGPFQPELLPAQGVMPVNGTLQWLVDQDAAGKL